MKKPVIILLLLLVIILVGVGLLIYQTSNKLPLPIPPTKAEKLAEFHLVGGIAGFRDHLVVYNDGGASVLDDVLEEQKNFQVETELFSQLMAMATRFGPFTYEFADNPGGPDSLYTKLVFYGQGPRNSRPNQEEQDNFLRIMTLILSQKLTSETPEQTGN